MKDVYTMIEASKEAIVKSLQNLQESGSAVSLELKADGEQYAHTERVVNDMEEEIKKIKHEKKVLRETYKKKKLGNEMLDDQEQKLEAEVV